MDKKEYEEIERKEMWLRYGRSSLVRQQMANSAAVRKRRPRPGREATD